MLSRARRGETSTQLMHAVDWLPTLMAAVGKPVAGKRTNGKIVYPLNLIIYLFIQNDLS